MLIAYRVINPWVLVVLQSVQVRLGSPFGLILLNIDSPMSLGMKSQVGLDNIKSVSPVLLESIKELLGRHRAQSVPRENSRIVLALPLVPIAQLG